MLFYEYEPWGYFPDEYRAGLIASTVVNTTPRVKGSKMYRRDEWCIDRWKGSVDEFTPEQREFIEKRKARGKKRGKRR